MIIGHCFHFLHVQTSTFLTETAVVIETESHMTSHDPPVSNLGGVGVWSVEGSIMSTKEFDFTVPNDTMKEEQKKADSLDLVIDLIHRVNGYRVKATYFITIYGMFLLVQAGCYTEH